MYISELQIGIFSAILRFLQRIVSDGHVPSTGNALIGNTSPSLVSILPMTSLTKSRASEEIPFCLFGC
jgi:hypothetical protein